MGRGIQEGVIDYRFNKQEPVSDASRHLASEWPALEALAAASGERLTDWAFWLGGVLLAEKPKPLATRRCGYWQGWRDP